MIEHAVTTVHRTLLRRTHAAERLLALVVLLAASCASAPNAMKLSAPAINQRYRDVIDLRETEYRIKPGDVLSVEIYAPDQQDLDQAEIIVRPDGRGEIFFLPDHLMAGKTVGELREEFEARLRAQVRDAVVSIQVRPRGEQVYLAGQFVAPQVIDLSPGMTLGQAVTAVGGQRVTASSAVLHRPFLDPENPEIFRLDLDTQSSMLILLPGDQIVLERTWCAKFVAYWQEYVLGLMDIRLIFGPKVEI